MSDSVTLSYNQDLKRVTIDGELSFTTARSAVEQAQNVFADLSALNIDLSAVSRSDSAGVAVLVDWMRYARQNKKDVVFHNIPAQILAIASASGLDEVLPVASSD